MMTSKIAYYWVKSFKCEECNGREVVLIEKDYFKDVKNHYVLPIGKIHEHASFAPWERIDCPEGLVFVIEEPSSRRA